MAEEGDPGFDPYRRSSTAGAEEQGDEVLMDEAKLKKIFNQFDSDKSGSIDVSELADAMRMLGVKCSANSAKKVLDVIDTDKNGTVEWEEFHAFFVKVRNQEEIKQLLSSCNQKFLDYKMMVEGDPNFGKRFYVPPMLSSRQKFARHNDNVEAVCWLKGDQFVSCSIDGDIMVWSASDDAKNPKPVQTFSNPSGKGLYCMNATADGSHLVTGSGATADNVALWNVKEEKVISEYSGHTTACYCISLAMDGNRFATGGKNGMVITYDKTSGEPMCSLEAHTNTVYGVNYRDDCNTVCSCSGDGAIKIWDLKAVRSAKAMATIEDAAATGVVYNCLWRGEHEIISCGDDFCIKRWDLRKLSEGSITNYFGHTSTVKSICLSADNKFLVSATDDGSIRLWLADEVGIINDCQVEAANKIEAREREMEKMKEKMAGGGDCDIMDVKRLQASLDGLYGEQKYVNAVRKERDSMSCVQARVCLEGHTLPVIALCWHDAEGSTEASVLSASQDQTIRIFDIDRGDLEQFELWSKEEDEPENRRPSKEAYRRPSKTTQP